MQKKQVSVRLSEVELAQVEILAGGGSREGWFRNLIAPMAESRVETNKAAIQSFLEVVKAAVEDGNQVRAEEYRKLISEYEAEIAILYKRA